MPAETRLGLAPAPAECAADTQQAFVVTTGADGLAQVVSVDAKPVLSAEYTSRPPKLFPAELTSPLKAHLQRLGYAATVSTITPTVQPHDATLPPQCSLITVSWK